MRRHAGGDRGACRATRGTGSSATGPGGARGLESLRRAGAYILVIDLDAALWLDAPRPARTLPPGRYVYCGSANGPGGIAGRLRRHLKPDKAPRWHVDRLTTAGRLTAAIGVPGGRECALFRRVLATPGACVPVPGFGSCDCRRCPAHLAAVPAGFDGTSIIPRDFRATTIE